MVPQPEIDNKWLKNLVRSAQVKWDICDYLIHQEHKATRSAFTKQVEQVKLDH